MTELAQARKPLVILIALGIASRIIFAIICAIMTGPLAFYRADTDTYLAPAASLLHGAFSSSGRYALAGTPEIFRTPGYPLLLAPAVALHHPVIIGLAENFLLVALSMWLVWKIASELFPKSTAPFWATLLFCFEPLGFVCSTTLMSETAFTAVFLLFIWLALRFFRQPAYKNVALAALALACATYIRPLTLYFPVVLAFLFLFFPSASSARRRFAGAVVFLLISTLAVLPWIIRNRISTGYNGFSAAQEWNLYYQSAAATVARVEHKNPAYLEREWGAETIDDYLAIHPDQRAWSNGQIAHFWGAEAHRILAAHPFTYAMIHAKGCFGVLSHPGVTEILQGTGTWQRDPFALAGRMNQGTWAATLWLFKEYPAAAMLFPLLIAQLLLYYGLGLLGLRYLSRELRFFFAAAFVYLLLVSGHPGMMARYKIPLLALVAIPAGAAIGLRNRQKDEMAMFRAANPGIRATWR